MVLKYFLSKHAQDLSLVSSIHAKPWAWWCVPITQDGETERQEVDAWCSLASHPTLTSEYQVPGQRQNIRSQTDNPMSYNHPARLCLEMDLWRTTLGMHTLGTTKIDLPPPQNQDSEGQKLEDRVSGCRLQAVLALEEDFTCPGSRFDSSELCCHHRHGLCERVHTGMLVPVEARRGFQMSWNWSYTVGSCLVWAVGTELGSSAKPVHILNH